MPYKNKISGIYLITNILNEKKYVGFSSNILGRFSVHSKSLKDNNHHCEHLQRAWNKYGEENFKFEIIEKCSTNLLAEREHYWAIKLNTHNRDFGYNEKPTSEDGRVNHSEETKKKISDAHIGRKKSNESVKKSVEGKRKAAEERGYYISEDNIKYWNAQRKSKPVHPNMAKAAKEKFSVVIIQMDLDGNFIKEWIGMAEAERVMGGKASGKISMVCSGKRKSAYGYKWKKKE